MTDTPKELFELKINETGIFYILKLKRIVGTVFIFLIIVGLFQICVQLYRLIQESKLDSKYGSTMTFQIVFTSAANMVAAAMNVLTGYLYLKFCRALTRSIHNHDPDSFNRAFKYIYQNAIVSVILVMLIVIVDAYYLVTLMRAWL